jgi:hypothetical protein
MVERDLQRAFLRMRHRTPFSRGRDPGSVVTASAGARALVREAALHRRVCDEYLALAKVVPSLLE